MRHGLHPAREHGSWLHRARDAAFGTDGRAIADLKMMADTHLTGESHVFTDACAAGDADLRRKDGVLTHRDVVRHLN